MRKRFFGLFNKTIANPDSESPSRVLQWNSIIWFLLFAAPGTFAAFDVDGAPMPSSALTGVIPNTNKFLERMFLEYIDRNILSLSNS